MLVSIAEARGEGGRGEKRHRAVQELGGPEARPQGKGVGAVGSGTQLSCHCGKGQRDLWWSGGQKSKSRWAFVWDWDLWGGLRRTSPSLESEDQFTVHLALGSRSLELRASLAREMIPLLEVEVRDWCPVPGQSCEKPPCLPTPQATTAQLLGSVLQYRVQYYWLSLCLCPHLLGRESQSSPLGLQEHGQVAGPARSVPGSCQAGPPVEPFLLGLQIRGSQRSLLKSPASPEGPHLRLSPCLHLHRS